jgi:hypothetical protein
MTAAAKSIVLVSCIALGLLGACTTAPRKVKPIRIAPEGSSSTTATAEMEDSVMTETRKTAATEMECPADELVVTCIRRDGTGGCVAIQAKGCGKTLEYSFGND